MMEISKGLRKEIMLVQNKLKNAIRDHQICMGKLEDNSNNADILGQIEEIRLHIISLGRCQKQVVQRLRKEVESFKEENANGAKVSVASLLGLNHNNNNNNNTNNNNNNKRGVTVDNEEKDKIVQVKVQSNGIFDSRRLSKENYEEVVRNGVVTASRKNTCAKERSRSVETLSGEEDVIEVSDDEKSYEKHDDVEGLDGIEEAPLPEQCKLNSRQVMFLGSLGLITASKFSELQNKRAERKRRSTANPQFVYSNWDIPTKRKRHSYLQSIGNAPQTRQTTARLNGPSPPPSKVPSSKSTSSPTKSSNTLILTQKAATVRPNILRNVSEGQEPINKIRLENGINELPIANVKSAKAKTMHIPGLPSCLTIERIESDTAVCIYCRNPGTLTFCDNCSISYHASCRSSSPPPLRLCSKCVQSQRDDAPSSPTSIIKNDEELEEKERERYEQRERNSDLRLQVYELEKRSQLLGQSFQLQNHMRQDLLTKQEKTRKSIKRLVDFIKLMQLRPPDSSPPPTMASANSQPLPTSSPLHRVISPVQKTFTPPINSPTSPTIPTSPIQLTSNTAVTRALATSPIHHSSSISSTINNNATIAIRCPSSTLKQRKSSSNHFLLSKKYPIHASVASSVITTTPITNPTTLTINSRTQQSITHYQCLTQKKDSMISSVPRHSSTITSLVVAPSQPFEATKSPPPARYPDSNPSHPRKSIPLMATMIAATSVPWNQQQQQQHQQQQQTDESNDTNPQSLESSQSSLRKINLVKKNQQGMNWSEELTSTNQTIRQSPVIYSTHCSQAITSPISAPIVLINHRETISMTSHQDQSQIVSIDDSPKINPVCEEQESPPPNSPNT